VNDGFTNTVHQPVLFESAPGRNDVTNSPKVGIVQKIAMMTAAIVAPLEVSRFCAVAS
jgi:hypothetical protein